LPPGVGPVGSPSSESTVRIVSNRTSARARVLRESVGS